MENAIYKSFENFRFVMSTTSSMVLPDSVPCFLAFGIFQKYKTSDPLRGSRAPVGIEETI